VDADFFASDYVVAMANNSYAAGTPLLYIEFEPDLRGVVELFGLEGYCNAGCTGFEDEEGRELEGYVVGVPTPEPSLVLLLGTGLLGLAPFRRKLVGR
jgi:PEP-CTERM motif